MSKQQQPKQRSIQAKEDLDFIICLSFHKLQEQNHHSLLPFVLIRNALTAQPPPQPSLSSTTSEHLVFSNTPSSFLMEEHQEEIIHQEEQQREQNWLDACFDDLNRQEQEQENNNNNNEDEDIVMEDDFGDMLFHASIQRARRHGESLSRHHPSSTTNEHYTMASPFFFPLDEDVLENKHDQLVNESVVQDVTLSQQQQQQNTLS
ncbi:hypothetical protein BDA99DRAFT_336559 [Phascolomyces articulosus]|uniref:Uncharacterized protein n=1 Tax=Phascolomyces articulosus TaxID=60185 RepID=A0AAD5PFR3_9FUNG|nr:hypothetical protein BDA99DRAFT_336559 [Phascolomyces articulosus]